MAGEGGPAVAPELRLPTLILAPTRSPGKEGRAGPPERRRELNDWDASRARLLRRQPPGASTYRQLVPLAPGGLELLGFPRLGPLGRPYRVAGRPLREGAPSPKPAR